MIRIAWAIVACVAALPVAAAAQVAATAQESGAESEIKAVMAASAAGWTAGDLDRFLMVYSDDPDITFTTSAGVVRGKAAIRERYVRDYPQAFGRGAGPATIPALRFTYEQFRPIGPSHVLVVARWYLGGGADAQSGLTSVLFRREPTGWRIVADHS